MCACGGVEQIAKMRTMLEYKHGPCSKWEKDSEPMRLLQEFKLGLRGCIGGSKAYSQKGR